MRELALGRRLARETAFIVAAYFVYLGLRVTALSDVAPTGAVNSGQVIAFERRLGLFFEPTAQAWLLEHAHWFILFSNWFYSFGFFPVLIGVSLIWLWFSPASFVHYRRVFLISLAITWLLYITFPLAPPRLVPAEGFVDTIAAFGPSFYSSKESLEMYNAYSAMPSMHFGWMVLVAIAVYRTGRPWLRAVAVAYPLMTLVVIVVTANHYWIDAVAGVAVVMLSFSIQRIASELFRNRRGAASYPA